MPLVKCFMLSKWNWIPGGFGSKLIINKEITNEFLFYILPMKTTQKNFNKSHTNDESVALFVYRKEK